MGSAGSFQLSGQSASRKDTQSAVMSQQREKDRQSASGKDDRAKKGGKGGSYTWEGDGSEDTAPIDSGDPNFADEEQLQFFDPHFHIWDLNVLPGTETTSSGHDASILFAPEGEAFYGHARYEANLRNSAGIKHCGGVYVEAMSVCFPQMSGAELNAKCIEEAQWTVAELGRSSALASNYVCVFSAALEAPNVQQTLDAIAALPNARGIRQIVNFEPSWPRNGNLGGDLLQNDAFRAGFASLAGGDAAPGDSRGRRPLSFDLQLNPTQYAAAAELIRINPGVRVIINHLGCPTLEDLTEPAKANELWEGMVALAACDNVVGIKLSMLCYTHAQWLTCEALVAAIHRVIEIFGTHRAFFASNYPVDVKDGWPADKLFSAFRQVASRYTLDQQRQLFSQSARSAYLVD